MLNHSLFDKLLKLPLCGKSLPATRRRIVVWETDFVCAVHDDRRSLQGKRRAEDHAIVD
jgi:hypothetical protein